MALTPVDNSNISQIQSLSSFSRTKRDISYGYIDMRRSQNSGNVPAKDKFLAATGSILTTGLTLAAFMNHQKVKNPLKVKYTVLEMLTMAAAGNIGGILFSSINEKVSDIKKKWKEGAFQMILTSAPMLLVDNTIKLCEKSKNTKINNNVFKIAASIAGVAIGSKAALVVSDKLRNSDGKHKSKRELKPIDMLANIDDLVAVLVLGKIPFADKIHIERALPLIYAFCGYRSGTGDSRH